MSTDGVMIVVKARLTKRSSQSLAVVLRMLRVER